MADVDIKTSLGGKAGKTTPVDADKFHLNDSAASSDLKTVTWANIKATAKTYFDTLYAAVVTAASTTEVLTGTDTAKFATPDAIAALWEKGSDIASAGTLSVGEGGYFHVTGTTTITDIDPATDKGGRHFALVFDGILLLTHHATTLILPTGANITTAAGDVAWFVSEGSDAVKCVMYQRATGVPLAGGGGGIGGSTGSTDNAVIRADGTGGATAQSSLVTIADDGTITMPAGITLKGGGVELIKYDNSGGNIHINSNLGIGVIRMNANTFYFYDSSGPTQIFQIDKPVTATQTGLMLYDVDNATVERVTVGAADSGGTGFKVLRIPN